MKKIMVVLAVLAIGLFFADISLADDVVVDVSNESTNNIAVEGGYAEQQQQMEQEQRQRQRQQQEACAIANPVANGGEGGKVIDSGNSTIKDSGNSTIKDSGNSDVKISDIKGGNSTADADASAKIDNTTIKSETTVKAVEGDVTNQNIYTSPEYRRSHIGAQPGPSGNFLGAGFVASKDWQLFICQPLFKSFTPEELEMMSDGAGGWFSSGIQKSLRIKKVSSYDENLVVRLDFIPNGPNDKVLGWYEYTADEPMPLSKALAHVIFQAKKDTNTHRIIVWVKERGEGQISGFSIGSGVAGAIVGGGNSDNIAGATAVGGIIGTTTSRTQEVYGIRVWALNEGSNDPPAGMEVCGPTVSVTTAEKIVEEEIPLQQSPCDADAIRRDIENLRIKISNCEVWGIKNMRLRYQRACKYINLALCTQENGFYSNAIEDFGLAEENYQQGKDISTHQAEADKLLADVYRYWGGCIVEISGTNAAMAFAQDKEITNIANGFKK
ncbi:MAG: hypothetical protein Q7U36_04880 [bacterium]|nr:hypothetical protein [bacterium]